MSDEGTIDSEPASLKLRSELPPLRIYHLLAWIAVMAAMFAVLDGTNLFKTSEGWWAATIVAVRHVLSSAALTCLIFGAVWWWKGLTFPSEPGHGLVILYGVATILSEAIYIVVAIYFDAGHASAAAALGGLPNWVLGFMRWIGPIAGAISALLCVAFSCWLVRSGRWRLVFIVVALSYIIAAVFQAAYRQILQFAKGGSPADFSFRANMLTDVLPIGLTLLFITFAAIRDRQLAIPRHWSHWVGVFGYGFVCAFKLIQYLVWHLLLAGA